MARAIRFEQFGGPDVLRYVEVEVPAPGPGQARVVHSAVGVNFIDVYHRTGLYPLALPSGLGGEAAGVVAAVGAGVTHVQPGDRVAYTAHSPLGAYSTERVLDARWLVRLPPGISEETGAAMMLKGLTAWYLLHRSFKVSEGDWILLYAAAGGVGSIAAQWARSLGVRVIGVVGSAAKREVAVANGCEHVLLASEPIPARVRELTGGVGVPVVYDSVGRDTFVQSLDCLRPHGVLVSFGNSSGKVEPFSLLELMRRGSLYVTRPTLIDFIRAREELESGCRALFEQVAGGAVKITIGQRYPLSDAAQAHLDLEARSTTGSSILLP
ncbi:MAG TPA: quinone oxidoreductase [Gammaproteobacteria bacterium]|nr:quinone oxidoreductase [Gammaproteobacteria bacterium]